MLRTKFRGNLATGFEEIFEGLLPNMGVSACDTDGANNRSPYPWSALIDQTVLEMFEHCGRRPTTDWR